jgi:hypothetical protein
LVGAGLGQGECLRFTFSMVTVPGDRRQRKVRQDIGDNYCIGGRRATPERDNIGTASRLGVSDRRLRVVALRRDGREAAMAAEIFGELAAGMTVGWLAVFGSLSGMGSVRGAPGVASAHYTSRR